MQLLRGVCLSFMLIAMTGCSVGPERSPVLGEAYVGPATLELRREITLNSGVAATLKHGERVEIIGTRRSFMKLRTASGEEGWTHQRELLSQAEMDELKRLEEQAKALPSQGVASTWDLLNVHTQPERRSPSYFQLKEGDKVEVVDHRLTPRVSTDPVKRDLLFPRPEKKTVSRKKEPEHPPPPMPAAPPPPQDWLQLSEQPTGLEGQAEEEPVPRDDWSLIRTGSGRAGWVLRSRIYLAIPDEVAQYAEGKRITSYFSLGRVQDGDQIKHHWLWTTIDRGLAPYQFDGLRVFIWNARRHRYETAYRERNLKGYYPVLVRAVKMPKPGAAGESIEYPGFSVLVEKEDGRRYRREYAFLSNVVRFAGETPVESSAEEPDSGSTRIAAGHKPDSSRTDASFYERVWRNVGALKDRVFGR
jgi:hypothetical protein